MLYYLEHEDRKASGLFADAIRLARGSADHSQAIALFERYAIFCIERSDYAGGEAVLREGLARAARDATPDDPGGIALGEYLAYVLMATQRYAESEILYKRSLAARRSAQLDIVQPLTQLAALAMLQDRLQEAEQYLRDARTHLYVAYPVGDKAFAHNDAELARLLIRREKFSDAEVLLKQALGILEKQPVGEEGRQFDILVDLGTAYYRLNRIDDAIVSLERALALAEKTYGKSNYRVATALNDLGVMESERGHLPQAFSLIKRALAMRETLLGPDHADCATSLSGLASIAVQQKEYALAEQYLLRALAINEAVGPGSSDVASDLRQLGALYNVQNQPAKALPILERAWTLPDAASSMAGKRAVATSLANVYRQLSREDDALVLDRWLATHR